MLRSEELHCPIEQQSADRLTSPRTSTIIFCSYSFTLSLLLFHLFLVLFSFLPPYYEFVELSTTTLEWKLGITFAQRLLLPSDAPRNAGVAAMRQMQCSVHRKIHREWEDMPPNWYIRCQNSSQKLK
jgi:hypothetical protein